MHAQSSLSTVGASNQWAIDVSTIAHKTVKSSLEDLKSGWPDRESNPHPPKCEFSAPRYSVGSMGRNLRSSAGGNEHTRALAVGASWRVHVKCLETSKIRALKRIHLEAVGNIPDMDRLCKVFSAQGRWCLSAGVKRKHTNQLADCTRTVSLLAYLQGEPGSIPGRVTPGFSQVGIVRWTMPLARGFSRGSPASPVLSFQRCSIVESLHPRWLSRRRCKSRPNLVTRPLPTQRRNSVAVLSMCANSFSDWLHEALGTGFPPKWLPRAAMATEGRASQWRLFHRSKALIGERRPDMLLADDAILLACAAGSSNYKRLLRSLYSQVLCDCIKKLRRRIICVFQMRAPSTPNKTRKSPKSIIQPGRLARLRQLDCAHYSGFTIRRKRAVDVGGGKPGRVGRPTRRGMRESTKSDANWGRGGIVDILFASHLGEPGSIPGVVAPRLSHECIVSDDAVGRWVFSGIFSFPRPCIPALLHTLRASPSSALKTSMLRAAPISPLHSCANSQTKRLRLVGPCAVP
ncbi:hypothetical protein PR048_028890 [Dryococelus australis]|uniref:Uncharacterized protein n=1 Tax=Dryococelus australis TaxID=614101 RepID=A0ABQ9GFM3_9NEOP|nr:hypothetical protein PR048_028890 [Dryococelus australis]